MVKVRLQVRVLPGALHAPVAKLADAAGQARLDLTLLGL
jgi:hypothetical protein